MLHYGADYSQLGTSIPVVDVVSPRLWRERYAFNLPIGQKWDGKSLVTADPAGADCGGCSGDDPTPSALTGFGLPDSVIAWHLRAALSALETRINTHFGIRKIHGILPPEHEAAEKLVRGQDYDTTEDRRPLTLAEQDAWWAVTVQPNVLHVERIRGYFLNSLILDYRYDAAPHAIIVESRRNGILHVISFNESMYALGVGAGTNAPAVAFFQRVRFNALTIPAFWAVDYWTGPISQDGSPGHIDAALADWCYARAGITLLAMDSVARQRGIVSASIGMDGASRATTLRADANLNGVLADRFDAIEKSIDWGAVRARLRPLRVRAFDG